MKRTKGMMSALLALVLVVTTPLSGLAYPTTRQSLDAQINSDSSAINNAQSEKKELESNLEAAQALKDSLEKEKGELTGYLVELDGQMTDVTEKLYEVEKLLNTKQEELKKNEEKLARAQKDIEQQYEDMKLRMKFMYEQGSVSYIQILLSAGSFSEMLNKAEYIEQVSAYDRELLEKFEETKDKVAKLEKELEIQEETLTGIKEEAEKQQDEMENLIADKQSEIEAYESDIATKEAAIEEYEKMIREQDDTIRALEKSVADAKAKRAKMDVSGNNAGERTYGGGAFCWPAPSYIRISDDYGYRTHPILGVQQFHNGVDMAAPSGSSILAAYDGTVVAASYNSTMGNYIMIDHGSGLYTIYMHASALYVSEGQDVSKGAQIAAVGSTGRSTGAHLHFSVRLNGNYVSPWNYL